MRNIRKILFIVDGGVAPVGQVKNIIESGAAANSYTVTQYDVDSSGDVSLYYKIKKN
jgi:hypothetical protein